MSDICDEIRNLTEYSESRISEETANAACKLVQFLRESLPSSEDFKVTIEWTEDDDASGVLPCSVSWRIRNCCFSVEFQEEGIPTAVCLEGKRKDGAGHEYGSIGSSDLIAILSFVEELEGIIFTVVVK